MLCVYGLLVQDIGTSESSLPYAIAQRRAENALRALKGACCRGLSTGVCRRSGRASYDIAEAERTGTGILQGSRPRFCRDGWTADTKRGVRTLALIAEAWLTM